MSGDPMTADATDRATTATVLGAREALTKYAQYLLERGEAHAAEDVDFYIHATYPAPAPRRVRVNVGGEWWVEHDEGYQREGALGTNFIAFPNSWTYRVIEQIRVLQASTADDSILAQESSDADSRRCKGPVSDDPLAGKGGASPDGPKRSTWQRFSAVRRERDELRSELARVQRERDEAIALACAWENAAQRAGEEMQDAVPADYFEMTPARWIAWVQDRARAARERLKRLAEEFTAAIEQRDAALDRALVAEQRIETGVVCWHYETDGRHSLFFRSNPADRESQNIPFTRGRFVADTEDKA